MLDISRKTMQDTPGIGERAGAKDGDGIIVGIAYMANNGAFCRRSEGEEAGENLLLHLARGVVVEVVEPGLANSHHPRGSG